MRSDESTIATLETMETESFVQVDDHTTTLTMTGAPRHAIIGLGTFQPSVSGSNGGRTKMTMTDVCFSLCAGEMSDNDEERAPVDLVVALDRSGSMYSRGKLDLAQKTLIMLLQQLRPQDRFGLITYSNEAQITVPILHMTDEHKNRASKAIKNLTAGGGTNMSAAVGTAAQEIRTIEQPNPVQTVFFLTDGHANTGISQVEGLVNLTRNCFGLSVVVTQPTDQFDQGVMQSMSVQNRNVVESDSNNAGSSATGANVTPAPKPLSTISMHCFGYGGDHNATLLRQMASATEGGSYYFIEEDKDVGKAFGDALGGVLSIVAQNATVTVEVPTKAKELGVEIVEVLHDQAIKRENGSYTVTLGDFFAEEKRDLVLTVKLATPARPTEDATPHVVGCVSYTDTLQSRLAQGERVAVSIARPEGGALSSENEHVAAQSFRVQATKEMEAAERLAAQGRFQEAQTTLRGTIDNYSTFSATVQSSAQASECMADAQQMEKYMTSERAYKSKGHALMSNKLKAHKEQRAAVSNAETSSNVYKQSCKRGKLASKFSIS